MTHTIRISLFEYLQNTSANLEGRELYRDKHTPYPSGLCGQLIDVDSATDMAIVQRPHGQFQIDTDLVYVEVRVNVIYE